MKVGEKDIFKVVAYFSYFGYPVTAFEIWKWQFQPEKPLTLAEVIETLNSSSWLKKTLRSLNGHYGIGDIESQYRTRHRHYIEAVKKYKKLQAVLSYVARVPGIEALAICNSLPFHFTREESDIDLFVVTENGKLWSSRLMAVSPMLLLRQRPGEVKKSPVDMSFFLSKKALSLKPFRLDKSDPYFSFWLQSLVPVYEKNPGFFHMLHAQNNWAAKDLPMSKLAKQPARFRKVFRGTLPLFISESFAEKISKKRLPTEIQERANKDSCVVMNKDVLKFHTTDRRQDIADSLEKHMGLCETGL